MRQRAAAASRKPAAGARPGSASQTSPDAAVRRGSSASSGGDVARPRRARPTRARAATAGRAARARRPSGTARVSSATPLRSALRAVIATESGDQSVASTRAPAAAAAIAGQAEPAAELDRAPPRQRPAGDDARERQRARPQLGPVGQELLLRERLLAEQRLAVARREQQQLEARERDDVLDEVVHAGIMSCGDGRCAPR